MILEPSGEYLTPLPWHLDFINQCITKPLPQALFIQGRSDDGLSHLCLSLASTIIAKQSKENENLIKAGTHPDLHYITQHYYEKTNKFHYDITIDDVRHVLNDELCVTPNRANHRICVIVPACHMNTKSASVLLKILEEPHPHLKFILGCTNISLLPATIKSRCIRIMAPKPSTKEASKYLQSNKVPVSDALLAISNYAPFTSINQKNLEVAYHKFSKYCSGNESISGVVKEFEGKEDAIDTTIWLSWAINWVAQALRINLNIPSNDQQLKAEAAKVIKKNVSNIKLIELFDELLYLQNISRYEINKRLVLERVCNLFLKLNANAYR